MTRESTQTRLDEALSRLLAGQPTITDGELTVSNLCKEAGVGRDSYYRSPQIVEKYAAAKANAETRKPELVHYRDQCAALKREIKTRDRGHTAVVRDLEELIQVYANHIQVLTLRNEQLDEENRWLRERIGRNEPNVVPLGDRG